MADKAPGIPEGLSTATVADLPALETETTPETDAGATDAPPPRVRRKRGPNKKKPVAAATGPVTDPKQEQQELAQLSQAFGASFQVAGNLVAAVRGSDHWKVDDNEAKSLGDVWAVALRPYMGAMAPYMPFVMATVVTVGVFAPKVRKDMELRARPRPLTVTPASPRIAEGSTSSSQLEPDPDVNRTPDEDAPHLHVEGGFLPPDAVPETNNAEPNAEPVRRSRSRRTTL